MDIQLVDSDAVHALGGLDGLIAALREGHRQPEPAMRRIVYGPEGHEESFMALPAWAPGEAIGIKLATIFPGNLAAGKVGVQAVYILFDGTDGRPLALLDGTALTYRKTAADSALGADFLAPATARTMLMVGAGGLSPYLIAGHRTVRPTIDRVLVWNRSRARAEDLVSDLIAGRSLDDGTTATGPVDATVVEDLPAAVASADVICTATMAADPVVLGEWLTAGTHLDCVGAFLPHKREVDTLAVRRSSVHVDSYDAAVTEGGDLVIPLEAGEMTHEDIRGDLYALVGGAVPGRTSEVEITMFANGGGGHLDLMTARHVWAGFTR